jgi:hypothetical protein
MKTYFVYGNLKVNPFILNDTPLPGFEILSWDHESWTEGTLLDLGNDAGFTPIGHHKVYGQIWIAKSFEYLRFMEESFGVHSGISSPEKIVVKLEPDTTLEAITYRLTNIPSDSKIIKDGKWIIKRQ